MNETIILISIIISIIVAGCMAYNAGRKSNKEYVLIEDFKDFKTEVWKKLDMLLEGMSEIKGFLSK